MAYNTDIERLNYYEGEILGATDFQTEQEYLRDMRRRHNIGQHTWGIVTGLDIVQIPNNNNAPDGQPAVDIFIQPGMAVDAYGREIVALSKTQLTQDLFAPYVDINIPVSQPMYVWISYAQVMLQPPADPCTVANQPNSFGRVQEAFALTVTQDPNGPANDLIVVDGKTIAPPALPGDIVFPADDSIPYQEFSTDDSTVNWYILLGQVLWYPSSGVFEQTADTTAATGRQYAGSVASAILSPDDSLRIQDRFAPYPLPTDPTKPNGQFYGGVGVEVAGSLKVDRLLEAKQNVLIDGVPDAANPNLSPLTINASSADQSLVQFRDSSGTPLWSIWETPKAANPPGLNFGETDNTGKPSSSALFIQKGGNVGVGTPSPSQNLSVNGGLNIDQAHQNNGGSLSPGLSFGPNAATAPPTEGIASNQSGSGTNASGLDFYTTGKPRVSIFSDGKVGIGTADAASTPSTKLQVEGKTDPEAAVAIRRPDNSKFMRVGVGSSGVALDFDSTSYFVIQKNTQGISGNFAGQGLLYVGGDGKVGIGTGSPSHQLEVLDTGSTGLRIQTNTSGGTVASFGGLGDFQIDAPGVVGGRLTVKESGTVGIGTASPAHQLEVVDAGSTGLRVQTNIPGGTVASFGGLGDFQIDAPGVVGGRLTVDGSGNLRIGANLSVNGNRTYLIGQDGASLHWIMCGGTAETVNNAIGLSFNSAGGSGTIQLGHNWAFSGGLKVGYLADRFVSRGTQKLERGDVVVLHTSPASHPHGAGGRIPLPEVQVTNKECDTRVCGIVDDPVVNPTLLNDLNAAELAGCSVGVMVTLGAYAHCKADADAAPISPGDLLTTSSTPGHVQRLSAGEKVQPGSIIGKALGHLKKGKGQIPVLVSHQ